MIANALAAWILAQPALHDGNGAPIPRLAPVVEAIAIAAVETCEPAPWAALLDVWAAYESGYRDIGGGCPGTPIGVACFVKQLGAQPYTTSVEYETWCAHDGSAASVTPKTYTILGLKLRDRKGGDMAEWSRDLRVREFPWVRPCT